jgi:plasmid stabilization system protein ParE
MPPNRRLEWSARAERECLEALAYIAADSGARNANLVMQRIQIVRFLHQRMDCH